MYLISSLNIKIKFCQDFLKMAIIVVGVINKFLLYNFNKGVAKKMIPVITEDHSTLTFAEIFQDVNSWRKQMIHYLKEENPEVNSAIIEAAQQTGLDPKAIALGAYMVYSMLEKSTAEQDNLLNSLNS